MRDLIIIKFYVYFFVVVLLNYYSFNQGIPVKDCKNKIHINFFSSFNFFVFVLQKNEQILN